MYEFCHIKTTHILTMQNCLPILPMKLNTIYSQPGSEPYVFVKGSWNSPVVRAFRASGSKFGYIRKPFTNAIGNETRFFYLPNAGIS